MNCARSGSPASSMRSANATRGVSSSGCAQMARYSASCELIIVVARRRRYPPGRKKPHPHTLRLPHTPRLCQWRKLSRPDAVAELLAELPPHAGADGLVGTQVAVNHLVGG